MSPAQLALLAAAVLLYAALSKRLGAALVTMPMAMAGAGFAFGAGGLGLVQLDTGNRVIHALLEVTLVLILFSDAARLDVRELLRERRLEVRMLLLGLPLAILFGAALAGLILPGVTLPAAFLLAAVLAPTDAALGQAVVESPDVPEPAREVLAAESGLNDGLALPAVVGFAIWAGASADAVDGTLDLLRFAALQIVLGPSIGVALAYLGARALDRASEAGWTAEPYEGIALLGLALQIFSAAEFAGGNGFLAAFSGGLTLGCTIRHRCGRMLAFMDAEGQILAVFAFLLFGTTLLPIGLEALSVPIAAYALGSLFVVRVLAISLSLAGSGVGRDTALFFGWFGPRGLASILFATLILEEYPIPEARAIHACVVVTVLCSIVLHGVSAAPLAKLYGRRSRDFA